MVRSPRLLVVGAVLGMLVAQGDVQVARAASSGGCAAVDVQTSPDTVTAGYGVGIYGSINNCSSSKKRYTVVVSATSACRQKTTVASFRLAFDAGENRLYGVSYDTSTATCTGASTVTVQVIGGSGVLATAATTFTII